MQMLAREVYLEIIREEYEFGFMEDDEFAKASKIFDITNVIQQKMDLNENFARTIAEIFYDKKEILEEGTIYVILSYVNFYVLMVLDSEQDDNSILGAVKELRNMLRQPLESKQAEQAHKALAAVLGFEPHALKEGDAQEHIRRLAEIALSATSPRQARGEWSTMIDKERKEVSLQSDIPPLPDEAPALWKEDRQKGENPADFIQRVYAPWVNNGLSRADIGARDKLLYNALAKHISRHGLPEGMSLPKEKEITDMDIEKLDDIVRDDLKRLRNLSEAIRKRSERSR